MKKKQRKFTGKRFGPNLNIIVNPQAAEYSKNKIDFLINEITAMGGRYFLNVPESAEECTNHIKRIINKQPNGIIVCGGDGTVNLVARSMIRRKIGLGIYPLGRFNNIYRSLYGKPDLKKAVRHILSLRTFRIDCGMAGRQFFLNAVAFGLIPEMLELLLVKKNPRTAIGWSRLAAQAAAAVDIKPISIKLDAFAFELSPQILNINILSHCLGMPVTPASINDDGKSEVAFDVGKKTAIMSSYIRQVYKKKYIYSDEIRMYRGQRISIVDVKGRKMYIDGEITESRTPEIDIEILPGRIRVFHESQPSA